MKTRQSTVVKIHTKLCCGGQFEADGHDVTHFTDLLLGRWLLHERRSSFSFKHIDDTC